MKKAFFVFLLLCVLCLSLAQAESGVLPADAETFLPVRWADGTTRLDWGGPVLPEGTAYTLQEIAITGWDSVLGDDSLPFRKFARISYTDENGENQEAWVMHYLLNLALPVQLTAEDEAVRYARRFFTNAYIQAAEADTPIAVTPREGGWRARLQDAQGQVTHALSFDTDGKIAWYRDFVQPLVPPASCEHSESLAEAADQSGVSGMLEWASQELLPMESFESIATVEQNGNQFCFLINHQQHYVLASAEPTPHILQYINMETGDAAEPYLSREEALGFAREALRKAADLPEDEVWECTEARFRFRRSVEGDPSLPGPYWSFVFIAPDETLQYQILLNAQSGELLQALVPDGNG